MVWTVSAYSTNIWSPIQFVKQLFVRTTGQVGDVQGATIKIDGTNWRIDAKSMYENRVQVATKSDLTTYATKSDLNSKVNWLNTFVTSCNKDNLWKLNTAWQICITKIENQCRRVGTWWNWHPSCHPVTVLAWQQKFVVAESNTVSKCNAYNIGKHNLNGRTCISLHVTNDPHCINSLEDGEKRQESWGKLRMCKDGHRRTDIRFRQPGLWTFWKEGRYVGRYFVYEFVM